MSCNYTQPIAYGNCGCTPAPVPCCPPTNTRDIAGTIYPQNSWIIPAVGAIAEIDVPVVKNIIVGGYIWNPTYGYFLVTSFNTSTGKLAIENNSLFGKPVAGSVVPAFTPFQLTDSPNSGVTDYSATLTVTGLTVVTKNRANWWYAGNGKIGVDVDVTGTASSTTYVVLSMPMIVANRNPTLAAGGAEAGVGPIAGTTSLDTSSTGIRFNKYNGTVFADGSTNIKVYGELYYQV